METSELALIKRHADNPFGCSPLQLGVDLNLVIAALETAQARISAHDRGCSGCDGDRAALRKTLRAWEKNARGSYHEALEDVLSLIR